MSSTSEEKVGLAAQTGGFVTGSWEELKKVTHPTRQETVQATLVVLLMMVIVSTFLCLVDWLFHTIMRSILS